MYTVAILGALASSAMAQAITFSNTTFTAPVRVGSTWPISFSAGNGEPVAIAFGNSTYAFQVVGMSFPPLKLVLSGTNASYRWSIGTRNVQLEGGSASQRCRGRVPAGTGAGRLKCPGATGLGTRLQPSLHPRHPT